MIREMIRGIREPRRILHYIDRRLAARERERRWRACDLERERARSLTFLSERSNSDAAVYLSEYRESRFLEEFKAALQRLWTKNSRRSGTTCLFDCETMYLTVRALKPRVVVETGVLYGALTAHILEAMEKNGGGRLVSLDLPNEDPTAPPKAHLVPSHLRERVELVLGNAKATLPGVLADLGSVDLFSHDSLHTVEHMTWEYLMAHRHLRPGGILCSHDVMPITFWPSPFVTMAEGLRYDYITVFNFGVAVKPTAA